MADHKNTARRTAGSRPDPYQQITDRIVEALEQGVAPWVKPWRALGHGAILRNAVSHRPYHGINVWLLGMTEYADPRWLTFRQAKQLGGHVRKGEKGTTIVFWKMVPKKETDEGGVERKKVIPFLRTYTVFNVEQCDGLKLKERERQVLNDHERDEQLDGFVKATGARIDEGVSDRAAYNPTHDRIVMPVLGAFKDRGAFYGTLLHELTHWTGHEDRMNRLKKLDRFGSDSYAMEELVAEMGAAFLCQRFAVDGLLQHESYIASWLKVLREDKKAIFTAASQARKACQWCYEKTGFADLGDDEESDENKTKGAA